MDRKTITVILALSFTQIVGWCSTFYMSAVLGYQIQADLGLSAEMVFGGVAAMYVVGALAAPTIGALIDRWGARFIMTGGSLAAAVGLTVLAQANCLATYILAWVILGLMSAAALSSAAYAALAQVAGVSTTRAVTMLMFATGLASTISLPIVYFMGGMFGWRGTTLLFAATHLILCLPLHFVTLPRFSPRSAWNRVKAARSVATEAGWSERVQQRAFLPLSIALALNVFVTSGLALHLVGLLKSIGFAESSAVFLASLAGPVQVATRAVQVVLADRRLATTFALIGAAALPISMAFLLFPLAVAASVDVFSAIIFVGIFGISNGLMVIARAALPFQVFGAEHYGSWTGRLAASQYIATAVTPVAFAAALNRGGAEGALMLAIVAGSISLAALAHLRILNRVQSFQNQSGS